MHSNNRIFAYYDQIFDSILSVSDYISVGSCELKYGRYHIIKSPEDVQRIIMVDLCNRADHYIFIVFMVALCNMADDYIFAL